MAGGEPIVSVRFGAKPVRFILDSGLLQRALPRIVLEYGLLSNPRRLEN